MSMLAYFAQSRFRSALRPASSVGGTGSGTMRQGDLAAAGPHFVSAEDNALHVAGEGSGLVQQALVPVTEHDELPRSVGAMSGAGRPSNGPSGSASSGLGCLRHA